MTAWLAQHARCFALTLTRLARTPLGSALSIVVIGIALSLPVGLYLLIDNLQRVEVSHDLIELRAQS